MKYAPTAGAFVKIVDILGEKRKSWRKLFQFRQRYMSRVRLGLFDHCQTRYVPSPH
jgi:hypothetical protein